MPKSSESDHSEAPTGGDVTPSASAPQAATWVSSGCEWVATSPEGKGEMLDAFQRVLAYRAKLGLDVASSMRVVRETEAAAVINGGRTFVIQPAGDNPQPSSYDVKPGGEIVGQHVSDGDPVRLVGFRRDLSATNVDVDLSAFSADPQQVVGMYAVVEDRDGNRSISEVPIESVGVAQEDAADPTRIIMIVEDEAAALFNPSTTFVIQPAGDNPQPYPYYIEPGGAVGRQDVWNGNPERLVGFQRDLREMQVDLELDAFYDNPQQAVGMYAVFEDSNDEMWTLQAPIASVRPTAPSKCALRWDDVQQGHDDRRATRRQPPLTQNGTFRPGEGAGLQDVVAIVDPKRVPTWPSLVQGPKLLGAAAHAFDATRIARLDPGSAAAFKRGFTFAIELAEDGNDPELCTYYMKPGGELGRQHVWMGSTASLVGFRGDADGVEVEVDLPTFYANPEGVIDLHPIFAFADGHRWTTGRSVGRVRPVPTEAAE
jgi:hypothetical protein